jgi:serine protease AprX
VAEFKPTGAIFNNVIGAGNAGLVYYDITGMRAWTWADFGNNLQIVIDQSGVNSGDVVYYDAVGLRVTSVPGSDTTAEGAPTNLPKAAIDTSRLLNVYNFAVRATDVWNEAPAYLQGQGVTVAVVDSGAVKNKDLGGRLIAKVNFNAAYHDSNDRYGHGTFVATLIGGDGKHSGGQYVGIAPKTNIVNVRISDDQGMATESDVINALQWVLEKKTRYSIRVVNLSLNSSVAQSYHTSPLDAACEILWFNGIVVVVSAGNNGSADLYPPANDPFVITVGATDDKGTVGLGDDTVASFSAYGTVENGVAKPELVAPGKNIVALLGDNRRLTIGQEHPANRIGDHYFRMSGTSMAAPMVSGAVALLLQDEPGLTPDQVKYRLMATAVHDPAVWPGYDPVKAGAGYLDIYAAVHGTSTESANTGLVASQLLWTGTEPVTWDSVNWNSVNWNSVNWNSVNWNSVNWNSVNWNSDYWGN